MRKLQRIRTLWFIPVPIVITRYGAGYVQKRNMNSYPSQFQERKKAIGCVKKTIESHFAILGLHSSCACSTMATQEQDEHAEGSYLGM